MANILIVDDDKYVLQQISKLITTYKHSPVTIQKPTGFFEILETKPIDLVLLDVHMPEIDGISLLKEMKADPTYQAIPVIMLTGDTDEKLLSKCFEKGAIDFINKPVKSEVLQARVQSALKTYDFISQLIINHMKAEEATKMKDKFVSLVAHDLKSPFNAILGSLNILSADKTNPIHPYHKEMIDLSIKSGKRLVNMIDDLLKISRLQSGHLVVKPKFFDGHIAASHAISSFMPLAREKGIELDNKVSRGTRVYADFNLFCEVVLNLVSNAIKFSNKGDRITIFIPDCSTTAFAVKDTGIGIDDKHLKKIFQHGEKTSTKGTSGETGTGLGLPFSNDIMNAHGGKLWAESVEGEGSTFYAELPDIKPVVLIVDDDKNVRTQFKVKMKKMNLGVCEADNGEEALTVMQKIAPHLIVTDIEMPRMDGYKLLECIRKNPETKTLPVIIMTASSNIVDREKVFQLGADDFVNKPLVFEDLIPRVKRFTY